jgi:formylglycine-generating enzyme required for sulfatase activity
MQSQCAVILHTGDRSESAFGDRPMENSLITSTFDFEFVSIDTCGHEVKRDRGQASFFTEALGDGVIMEMVQIPEGTTQLGSPKSEQGRVNNEEEPHFVTPAPYFISKYPITQAQWKAVAFLPKVEHGLDSDPSFFKGSSRPVEQVSWYEAVEFCARLSRVSGRSYLLPTEVEWEYACRAGTPTPFHFGETLTTDLANYCGEDHYGKQRTSQGIFYSGSYGKGSTGIDRKETTEVNHFQAANGFGLYAMHGTVWEWCSRRHESHLDGESPGEEDQRQRPLRGGSWKSSPLMCRSASRLTKPPAYRESFVGFRVVYSIADGHISSDKPSQNMPSQSIFSNVHVGGDLTVEKITQIIIQHSPPQKEK